MRPPEIRYNPDEWAHDLDQWFAPLASLAEHADCGSAEWLTVLGVAEFFDPRILQQARVLTPWICLAASAAAAAAAGAWASIACQPGRSATAERRARTIAVTAFDLAVSAERHRWSGRQLGSGPVDTGELASAGRTAVGARHGATCRPTPVAVDLVAGWLAHSGGQVPPRRRLAPALAHDESGGFTPERAVAVIARAVRQPDALTCGTAYLVERFAAGTLDRRQASRRPDDPPFEAVATVLLAAERGQIGFLEARRQHSQIAGPAGTAVPDLARMAFVHGNEDFVESVSDALAAARRRAALGREGELISWSLQLPGGHHPLAERALVGRSAGLGAYVAFRSLSHLSLFAEKDVAFTGQVTPDGSLGEVGRANDKIGAAGRHRIRVVVHPTSQPWRDPDGAVQLHGVERAEDALITSAPPLRQLRSYLEAACRLVAPEPWLQTWWERQGRQEQDLPLLDLTARRIAAAGDAEPHQRARRQAEELPRAEPPGRQAGRPEEPQEPEVPPGPAHLLAETYPGYSFAISADAGGGSTVTAKRMVAEAGRQALDCLRALNVDEPASGYPLPLYVPLGELPASWDELVQAGVEALPTVGQESLEVAAALAMALREGNPRRWRPLVVIDGTDRTRWNTPGRDRERDFIAFLMSSPERVLGGWHPARPAQVVLCGRNGGSSHLRTVAALRRERPGEVAVMRLDPLAAAEIDRFLDCISNGKLTLAGPARDLAANPLLLTLSVIVGHPRIGEADATELFDRGIDVLLGQAGQHRRFLAEIAFRAAVAKGTPAGEFTLSDLALPADKAAVDEALALPVPDRDKAWTTALSLDERSAITSAEAESHLLTTVGGGWRYFHDRALAFLAADRVATCALAGDAPEDEVFGMLGRHLADPFWADVVEATGRLLELRSGRQDRPEPPDAA